MEVRSFPALLSALIQHKKPCEQKFTLDCLLMEVAGANRRWRCQFRYRGSRHESAVAQLYSLGGFVFMLIECNRCKARVDAEIIGMVEEDDFIWKTRTYLLCCPVCKLALVGESDEDQSKEGQQAWTDLVRVHPKPRRLLGSAIPATVRMSLEEAERCMQVGAFLAAAAMAGRALEAVCRHYSTKDTYIGAGIKELRDKGIIDARLFEWSEELRDQRNMAAHATEAAFNSQDADDILTFTYAIVDYVFLLTRKFEQFQKRKMKKAEEKAKSDANPPAT